MKKLKIEEEHENVERWLVSYADFITLLFAFFVVMYALSSINESKYKVLSESLDMAFNAQPLTINPIQIGETVQKNSPTKHNQFDQRSGGDIQDESDDYTVIADEVNKRFQNLSATGAIQVFDNKDTVEIQLKTKLLFNSGSAVPNKSSLPMIQSLAEILKNMNNLVRVEGYTDNIPINNDHFSSNWQLSAGRAASIVQEFVASGVPPYRLSAVGFGEQFPIAENDTPEGRESNRRVMIVIDKEALTAAPKAKAKKPADFYIKPEMNTDQKSDILREEAIRAVRQQRKDVYVDSTIEVQGEASDDGSMKFNADTISIKPN